MSRARKFETTGTPVRLRHHRRLADLQRVRFPPWW